ncbi:MAG: 3-oxoadipate enol-lactonase [bacterium]|jgi:3-oxoadipate enol-lactonase
MSGAYKLKTKGLEVNIRVEGTGSGLLFLGGSNFDLSIRAPVFESALAQHFEIAAADPRGLGTTDAPDGDWTMQDYAQDALRVLDALGWEHAYILGESFGAMTALHMAALAPERIIRMALAAGSAGGAGGSSYPVHKLRDITDPKDRARVALGIMDDRFMTLIDTHPAESEKRINARVAAEAVFLASSENERNHPRLLAARAAHDAWGLLPDISIPTLVFAGRYDQQAPVDCAENIVNAMPNAALHIVDGGHSLCFANPDPVATIIQHWSK